MDTNTIRNESGMNKTCTVCWKLKAAHEVADLNGEDICTRCAAKYIKYHHPPGTLHYTKNILVLIVLYYMSST